MNNFKSEDTGHTGKDRVGEIKGDCGGELLFLKTPLETRTRNPLVDVYVTVVPVKKASSTLE
jgi:hypothetical protein